MTSPLHGHRFTLEPYVRAALAPAESSPSRRIRVPFRDETRGEQTELVFPAPPVPAGLERTVFVKASGYYKVHVDATGQPQTELAERILAEPGFAARYCFREYLRWEAGLRAQAAKAGH